MGLYCLASPGGSPGVTTTALALALTWSRGAMVAECDPAGRRVVPGFLADRVPDRLGPGLLGLAMAVGRDPDEAAATLDDFVVPLDEVGNAVVLHGIRDPRHAQQLTGMWQPLASVLSGADIDVLADVGRIGGPDTPLPVLASADLIVLVLRRSLPQVDAARPRLDAVRESLGEQARVVLCLVGEGPYSAVAIEKALGGLPVIAELPDALADARVLSDGARPRLTFRTSLLIRAASGMGRRMRKTVEERAFHPETGHAQPAAPRGGR